MPPCFVLALLVMMNYRGAYIKRKRSSRSTMDKKIWLPISARTFGLVFRCYSVCETMKDTKEGYFTV